MKKKFLFLTGTRADFGKLKSLIEIAIMEHSFDTHILATGMHLSRLHGYTVDEIVKCGYHNIHTFQNHTAECTMDVMLANSVLGISAFLKKIKPDMIIVHGDRVEALAGAISGALNNILVAHIEGGEISGTIDELIRHAVTKMSHIHFVANDIAKRRLIQMGERGDSIFVIGSPDIDAMLSGNLPTIETVKTRYEIYFQEYAIAMFHPVTTEYENMKEYAKNFVDVISNYDGNLIVIYPNNDLGYKYILEEYNRLSDKKNIKFFPSVRFEYFLVLLKNSKFIVGNSSAGIREAPYYGIPTVNIGTRQNNRALHNGIINCSYEMQSINEGINRAFGGKIEKVDLFGSGNSDKLFLEIVKKEAIWKTEKQKKFNEIKI